MPKFQKGNPGRPKGSKNRTTIYRQALGSVVNLKREKAMWAAMLKKAVNGDVSAARLIAEYKHGKPQQAITLDGAIEHEHHVIPADELREIALRNAERIVEQHRTGLATKADGNGALTGRQRSGDFCPDSGKHSDMLDQCPL